MPRSRPFVRPLRRNDHAEWLRMRRALWPDVSVALHRVEMREQSRRSRARAVLVIDRDGVDAKLGGFIELSVRSRVDGSLRARVGYVDGWFVDPDLRGRTWGRQLMRAAEAWTAARGPDELASDAEIDNPASLAAHAALGFRETFRLVHFLKKVRRSQR